MPATFTCDKCGVPIGPRQFTDHHEHYLPASLTGRKGDERVYLCKGCHDDLRRLEVQLTVDWLALGKTALAVRLTGVA